MVVDVNTIVDWIKLFILRFIHELLPLYILPNIWLIVQIIVILLVGYVFGRFFKAVSKKILYVAGFRRFTAKIWAEDVLKVTGYRGNVVELIGDIVKWSIYIVTLAAIAQVLGFTTIATLFGEIIIFIPRIILSIIVIIIGFMISDFFGKVFEEAASRVTGEDITAKFSGGFVKYSVAMVAIIISLSLIGLDINAMLILFSAMLFIVIVIFSFSVKDILPDFAARSYVRSMFRVGEKIKVRGYSGIVEEIGPLHVTLLSNGRKIEIPNSILLKEPVEKEIKKKK